MILKFILVLHRYLGVLLGILMSLWCLSGFVMMYQSFPETTRAEQLRGMDTLDFSACCALSEQQLDELAASADFRIETLNGAAILRLGNSFRGSSGTLWPGTMIDLATGEKMAELNEAELLSLARDFARGNDIGGEARHAGIIEQDQWTVQTALRNAPVHKVEFGDSASTALYLSASQGLVIQDTNRRERVLAWLGAIPHWLYPLQLRQNGALWVQVVIWTSLLGTFLTLTGLYTGVSRLRRRYTDGKWISPYRGWWYWHHMTGLFFGILVLTWVGSGLLTMNPWGLLAGDASTFRYRAAIHGSMEPVTTRHFLANLSALGATNYVRLEPAPFANGSYLLATHRDGSQQRLDQNGTAVSLQQDAIQAALDAVPLALRDFSLLEEEDQYYYSYKGMTPSLPVYRATLDDEGNTALYINPRTGGITSVGANERLNRWTRVGLHRLDFAFMKARPVWDILVVLLLAGVTLVCVTGTWMSVRRIKLDSRRLRRKLRASPGGATPADADLQSP